MRACKGTYIRPTAEHLSAYVDEAVFRFNVRKDSEWERLEKAMRLIVGKRLTYATLTDGGGCSVNPASMQERANHPKIRHRAHMRRWPIKRSIRPRPQRRDMNAHGHR
jgi:hypothetical protein